MMPTRPGTAREVAATRRPASSPLIRLRALWKAGWSLILLLALGIGVSTTTTLLHSEALSPLDEWVYVDYLFKVPSQGIVRKGEPIGEEALDIIACDGVTPYGTMGEPCGSDYDFREFPFGGITSADPYPPLFFWVTRGVGDVIAFVTGVDAVTGWRLVSVLWLAAGLSVFFVLARRWGVSQPAIAATGLALIGSPLAYWSYSYVSTDAPAFLVGAVLLLLVTAQLRGRRYGGWIVLASALGALLKITNILGVGMIALILLIDAVRLAVRDRRVTSVALRRAGVAAASLAAAVGAQAIWLAFDRANAVSTMSAVQGVGDRLTVVELLSQTINFLQGTIVSNVTLAGSGDLALPIPGFAMSPLSWICVAGVLGAFFVLGRRPGIRGSMITAIAVASIIAAPALALALQVVTSSYFSLPSRYGASLLPGFLLLGGLLLRNRWATTAISFYALTLAAACVYSAYLLGRG